MYKRKKGLNLIAVMNNDDYLQLPKILQARFYPAPKDAHATHSIVIVDNCHMLLALDEDRHDNADLGTEEAPTENYVIETPVFETTNRDQFKKVIDNNKRRRP
jgi:hypothetical protein